MPQDEARRLARLKLATIDATTEAVAVVPARALGGLPVTRVLDHLAITRGLPRVLRTDNALEFRRNVRIQFDGWRWLPVEDGVENHRACASLERALAGRHLVQHKPVLKEVRTDIEFLTACLLG